MVGIENQVRYFQDELPERRDRIEIITVNNLAVYIFVILEHMSFITPGNSVAKGVLELLVTDTQIGPDLAEDFFYFEDPISEDQHVGLLLTDRTRGILQDELAFFIPKYSESSRYITIDL